MQSDWASQNLQIIRTLMERSAVYRRALAPLTALLGITGMVAAMGGTALKFQSARAFVLYWMGISVIGIAEAFLVVRRQALKADEPYWSPPTRRVAQAILPALFIGLVVGLPFLLFDSTRLPSAGLLVPAWVALYGCALHSAGFFMPRGVKLFGWGFILGGCSLGLACLGAAQPPTLGLANWLMGLWFGGAHLAYSIYLYFTENKRAAT